VTLNSLSSVVVIALVVFFFGAVGVRGWFSLFIYVKMFHKTFKSPYRENRVLFEKGVKERR